jgi:rsbT antagonist protein RsbS
MADGDSTHPLPTTSVPIVSVRGILLVAIEGELHDRAAISMHDAVAERLEHSNSRGVVIDVSAIPVIDTFIARMLISIAKSARLLGAVAVVVGIRPAVAMTLVELGMSLDGVATARDVDSGMALIERERGGASRSRS